MKKSLALPMIVLALSVIACGKKDSQDPNAVVQGVAPVGYNPYPYYPGPGGNGGFADIQSFCTYYYQQGYNASFNGSTCKIESTVYSGTQYLTGINVSWAPSPAVQVYTNDTVTYNSSGTITPYVGYQAQSSGGIFVANTDGQLYFKVGSGGFSWSSGSVSQIRLKRCYVMNSGTISTQVCP